MATVWRGVWRVNPAFGLDLNSDLFTSATMTSSDPQTIVYKINPKAVWSDGVPVTADDLIYNWRMALPGASDTDGSPIQTNEGIAVAAPIDTMTPSDDGKTVTAVLKEHNVEWQLGSTFNQLVPAHIANRVGFNSGFDHFDPALEVSDAPFRLASYNPGQDATLVRNERYWGTPAKLDRIVFRFTAQDQAVGALKNGEGDVMGAIALPDLVSQLESLPAFHTTVFSGLGQESLLFNERNHFLANPEVRKALALALDRRTITERVLGKSSGVGVSDSFLWANNQPQYHDTSDGRYDHPDLAGARRLLENAGFLLGADGIYVKDGKRLSFRISAVTDPPHGEETQLIQSQLRPLGVELRIDNASTGVVVPQIRNGDFDLAISSYAKGLFGTANFGARSVGAFAGYANTRVGDLMHQAHLELDDTRRLAVLDEADRILWADLPLLPLYQLPALVVSRNSLVNVGANPVGGPFWNVEQWARKAQR